MNPRFFFLPLLLAFALLAIFSVLNLAALATPVVVSIGFTEISVPLGMVMLAFTAVISALLIVYIVFLQANVMLETRRLAKEVKSQRALADTAEASRFTELRALVSEEMRKLEKQQADSQREFGVQIERCISEVNESLAESSATLTAYLGEIEDKLDRTIATHSVATATGDASR